MHGVEEVRTGRGRAGLVRGREDRYRTDETSRKGKGKGSGGKGEHESKGRGAGSKGTQLVENLVMDEDQENMRAMKCEEEEEDHREDVRKLVEMMQKEDEEQEEQRGRVAPNMGAGGSHPQAMSCPERRETQEMRWADYEDDEGKEEEEEQETEKRTAGRGGRKERARARRRRRERGRGRERTSESERDKAGHRATGADE